MDKTTVANASQKDNAAATTTTTSTSKSTGASSSGPSVSGSLGSTSKCSTILETILCEMGQQKFECVQHSTDDTRWKFRHPNTPLLVEIDLRIYDDASAKCAHVTASIYHPSGRRFLEPVILKERSDDLREKVADWLVSPLKLALFGHENTFLRFLGNSSVAEHLFILLTPRSILRLERINKYALEVCRSSKLERVWQIFLERDFGKGIIIKKGESYREAYKRMYSEQAQRRRAAAIDYERYPVDPHWITDPNPSYPNRPRIDPDMPQGPFHPLPAHPFIPPMNPFPSVPRPGNPLEPNPLDPLRGSELLPSRPIRPSGMPRQLPRRGPDFQDRGFDGFV
ncbi:unnamed protein product [Gongylonema pulchrum]|uniref:F-box domain-containing protein n=1 Tax=Gongylonema pulchrum TaxID=637853 RepID=A0A183DUM3_9BILA|nr:unnamed protein product [Gongylonema pulchrum]